MNDFTKAKSNVTTEEIQSDMIFQTIVRGVSKDIHQATLEVNRLYLRNKGISRESIIDALDRLNVFYTEFEKKDSDTTKLSFEAKQ